MHIFKKGVCLGALFLTHWNLANSKYQSGHGNGGCSRDVYKHAFLYCLCAQAASAVARVIGIYRNALFISAWDCTLSVLLIWAMREPQCVGRQRVSFPRFFCIWP